MKRRGFLAAVVGAAVAPFVPRPKAKGLVFGLTDSGHIPPRFQNYATSYSRAEGKEEEELARKMRRAFRNVKFIRPLKPPIGTHEK